MPEITLNLRGQICPDPLIQVQEAVRDARAGDVFLIVVDYPLAVDNIARWAEGAGFRVRVEPRAGEWEIRLEKD